MGVLSSGRASYRVIQYLCIQRPRGRRCRPAGHRGISKISYPFFECRMLIFLFCNTKVNTFGNTVPMASDFVVSDGFFF